MGELNIQSMNDAKKLVGWKIEDAQAGIGGKPNLVLVISHAAAEKHVMITINPGVKYQIAGNSMSANPGLDINISDVEKQEKKEE